MVTGVSTEVRDRVEASMAEARVADAFAALAEFDDLRHADQPPVSKAALRSIERDAAAVRALVLGLADARATIRGFCKKHVRRLPAAVTAGPLLRLAYHCIEPMRRGDGLLGDFDGWASPIGHAIDAAGLSTIVPDTEAHVYSPASRYAKDVAEAVVPLLARADLRYTAALLEYCEGLVRSPIDREPAPDLHEIDGVHSVDSGCQAALDAAVRKTPDAVAPLCERWVRRALLLDEPDDEHLAALARLFADRSDDDRAVARRRIAWFGAKCMRSLPAPTRGRLYAVYRDAVKALPKAERHDWDQVELKRFREQFPGEIDDAAAARQARKDQLAAQCEALRGLGAKIGGAAGGLLSSLLGDAFGRDVAGELGVGTADDAPCVIRCDSAIAEIMAIADWLGLRRVFKRARRAAGASLFAYGDRDERSYDGTPEDEAILDAALAYFVALRKAGRAGPCEQDLRDAQWSGPLDGLLRRCVQPWLDSVDAAPDDVIAALDDHAQRREFYFDVMSTLEAMFVTAFRLLPAELSARWAPLWREHVEARGVGLLFGGDFLRELAAAYESKSGSHAELIGALIGAGAQHDDAWCALAWQLYRRDDPRGHEVVREAVARTPLPKAEDYYRRSRCQQPYAALLHAAWRRGDLELIASAIGRCALPFAGKGAKARLVAIDAPEQRRNHAPAAVDGDGTPLAEVWARLRAELPERADAALDSLLPAAEFEDLPVAMLGVIAAVDDAATLSRHRDLLLSACDASRATAATAAFELLRRHPALCGDAVEDVIAAVEQALATPQGSKSKTAAALAAALCSEYPDRRDALLEVLFEALWAEDAPFVEKVLTEIARVLAPSKSKRLPRPPALDDRAAQRLAELQRADAKRFGKRAAALLELEA